jgi:glucose-6-phosphate 1-dehydrogenase
MAIIAVEDFDFVVFGATGDLTLRKLLPALYHRFREGQYSKSCRIIAAARSDLDDKSYRARAEHALHEHIKAEDLPKDKLNAFLKLVLYARVDGSKSEGWEQLIGLFDNTPERVRVFYLATSPDLYGAVCHNLSTHKLVTEKSRVVLEKPIGHDLASARKIIEQVGHVFTESQTFRIDHFLGKETVQNLHFALPT